MTNTRGSKPSSAYYLQSAVSFAVSLLALLIACATIPIDPWIRGFFAIGIMFLVSSSFGLAKVIRDQQESASLAVRLDQARIEKILAEHDPYYADVMGLPRPVAPQQRISAA